MLHPAEKRFLSAVFPFLQRHCGIPVEFGKNDLPDALSALVANPQGISLLLERNESADTPPLPNVVKAAINCLSTPGADRIEYLADDGSWRRLLPNGHYETFDPDRPSSSTILHRFPATIDIMKRNPRTSDNVYIVCSENFSKFKGPEEAAIRFFHRERNSSPEANLALIRVGSIDFIMDESDFQKKPPQP